NVRDQEIDNRIREVIQRVFGVEEGVERVFFPAQSSQVPDQPAITIAIMGPEHSLQEDQTVLSKIDAMTKEHGKSARTYKSALIWVLPDSAGPLKDEARNVLAWEDISGEGLSLDESQLKQLDGSVKKASRDLTETVWRTYKHLVLLGRDNTMTPIDL